MSRAAAQLRDDVERIWWAGVRAVAPSRLIPEYAVVNGDMLLVGDEVIDLRHVGRIAVVGAGKAAGAMAAALARALGPRVLAEKRVTGWVNVPADCVVPTERIHLHAARPAGVNEPTAEAVRGTDEILRLVAALGPNDLCFCLLSGGGSALLSSPVPDITLDDKAQLARLMSTAGASIEQLNAVRRPLSRVKGGGLLRACGAGRLVSLLLSDVLGDPLEVIASGPTVDIAASHEEALQVLHDLKLESDRRLAPIVKYLQGPPRREGEAPAEPVRSQSQGSAGASPSQRGRVTNLIIGNNALAVDAAGIEAERLGYSHAMIAATKSEGSAEDVGRHLGKMALRMRDEPGPDCLISGGEPTVTLAPESQRGLGGRNQQLALAAHTHLGNCEHVAFLSAGTDGEDGPTDAAGAIVTAGVAAQAAGLGLNAHDHLSRNDAYHFFTAAGGLFCTGPTQTNVCDLRVIVVSR